MQDQKLKNYFSESIRASQMRVQDSKEKHKVSLNRNELPFDLPDDIKIEVCTQLLQSEWNLYPAVVDEALHNLLASYAGVSPDMICTGAGAAMLATSLMNYFALQGKRLVIPRPSFSLYEYHCKAYGIDYQAWEMDDQLAYTLTSLPEIKENDVVFVISPNNPTGAVLAPAKLEELLQAYPENLFIADEVYYEFSENAYTHLVKMYPNLVLLRSVSKTFSAAALRFGYLIASEDWCREIRKILLPFSVNLIASESVKSILKNPKWKLINQKQIEYIKQSRELVYQKIKELEGFNTKLKIFPSEGNFLLIQMQTEELHNKLMRVLESAGIQLLDTSKQARLERSIRMSIGKKENMLKIVDLIGSL